MSDQNRYERIIAEIFHKGHKPGANEVIFTRDDIVAAAKKLRIELPKNIGDLIYSFRYRSTLPASVIAACPGGAKWIIRPAGRARYKFVPTTLTEIVANPLIAETKVPDATPGIISMYALSDEQALLAKLRYNRLLDIFTGITCYSLQSHLRTTVPDLGQVETDEVYVGVDRRGAHYVIPEQAKRGRDRLNIVQIEQDFAMCGQKFKQSICRPVAAQFMADNVIALFAFEMDDNGIALSMERHYRLVPPDELTPDELQKYRQRSEE